MTEPIKTRYTWLIEYETPSDAPAAHAHMQALGGEVVAVQFSDALGELSRAEAEVERLRVELAQLTTQDWREEAGRWLRRKAVDFEPAAKATGYGNPAWWRPGLLREAAEWLDAEMAAAPFGLEAWQTPLPEVKEPK